MNAAIYELLQEHYLDSGRLIPKFGLVNLLSASVRSPPQAAHVVGKQSGQQPPPPLVDSVYAMRHRNFMPECRIEQVSTQT